ncbi:MAG: outer membrane beta-barrel protein, partial [Alphaproteobacteria bacterium]|nr:outer membrane beta-barrel protein [Alphaproteobacteria bacterium]
MKINSLSIISLVAVLSTATSANAGAVADFYAGAMIGAGGYSLFHDDDTKSDSSMLFGGVIGVDIPVFRIEAEYNYLNSSKLTGNTAMVNAYFKMPSTLIMPYAGAGIGMVFGAEYEHNDTTK